MATVMDRVFLCFDFSVARKCCIGKWTGKNNLSLVMGDTVNAAPLFLD